MPTKDGPAAADARRPTRCARWSPARIPCASSAARGPSSWTRQVSWSRLESRKRSSVSTSGSRSPQGAERTHQGVPDKLTRVPGEFTRVPGEFTRVPGEFTRVPGELTRVPGELTRVPGELPGGRGNH